MNAGLLNLGFPLKNMWTEMFFSVLGARVFLHLKTDKSFKVVGNINLLVEKHPLLKNHS